MGIYNPHVPYILGNEWVPIRDARYTPDNITERGYTFTLNHAALAVSGGFGINDQPGVTNETCVFVAVYPDGTEDLTGPVRSVLIPPSQVTTVNPGPTTYSGSLIADPGNTQSYISVVQGQTALINFNTPAFIQALSGKRILGMNLRYIIRGDPVVLRFSSFIYARSVSASAEIFDIRQGIDGVPAITPGQFPASPEVSNLRLSWLNPFWRGAFTPINTFPWRYPELLLLHEGTAAASRLHIGFTASSTGGTVTPTFTDSLLQYAALEVFYCEEKRVLYGGNRNMLNFPFVQPAGKNLVPLLTPQFTAPSALAAGRYVITHTFEQVNSSVIFGNPPTVTALRQLYELPTQQGRLISKTLDLNDEFTSEASDILPQITLHTAAAIVTGTHPYGTQIAAPVYGTTIADQSIFDELIGIPATQYPQVRFYARRFGDTTAPLVITGIEGGQTESVSITVEEFDALPEIVDGWREVTLRFTTAPTFPTVVMAPDWRWSAAGENVSNQWQILGANGPSLTGAQSTGPATYEPFFGGSAALTWQSPTVSGAAVIDPVTDATLMFSQDPPAVTGFALSTCSQAITGITEYCGLPNGCIATEIYGNQLSWNNGVICDTFSRTVTGSWGAADTGQSWLTVTGSASNFGVTDGDGRITHIAANTSFAQRIASPSADVDAAITVCVPALAVGGDFTTQLKVRYTDVSNYYALSATFKASTGVVELLLSKVVVGVTTSLVGASLPVPYTADACIRLHVRAVGTMLQGTAWRVNEEPEPGWILSTFDSSLTAAGSIEVVNTVASGSTNTFPLTFKFDDFNALRADMAGGFYEVQRWDEVDNAWSTILDTANLCVTGMCDFEARVGVESIYRMRMRNILDFAGPWVSGAGTIAAPGVALTGDGNSLLIFTSNKSPASNLAYTMQFENKPIETFVFPEADRVVLQHMYGRDFPVAFHPLEREGERFTRTILVNAAAIPLPSLGNVRNLRDLAWADLPYVCVRDELGNRWYANVQVPSVDVHSNREIYLAQIRVAEVASIPCPLDPA